MDTFATIVKRVKQKKEAYATYGFNKLEMAALNTFFDLAQEYDGLENLYLISITVPRIFFEIQSTLYMIDPKTKTIQPVADSHSGLDNIQDNIPDHIRIAHSPYQHDHSYIVPIPGKRTPSSHILFYGSDDIIGIFAATRLGGFTEAELFFIEKYVNRIGYNLYNKFLAEQNIQHLKFINNLVADIEHNVIVPNLRYKNYINRITKYLNTNKEIENDLHDIVDEVKVENPDLYAKLSEIVEHMVIINRATFNEQKKIGQHYKYTSLFLETLLRPDHFLYGQYILKKTSCYLWEDIILPQLGRYTDVFAQKGIKVSEIIKEQRKPEDIEVKADKGLMAQVVANLFSNAAKYTESVVDESGKSVKKIHCNISQLIDFFGYGHNAIRFHVLSSGQPISEKDSARIFEEGFRITHRGITEGAGHGLHFVKNVVEVHGGVVGHNPKESGNEFFFVIPQ